VPVASREAALTRWNTERILVLLRGPLRSHPRPPILSLMTNCPNTDNSCHIFYQAIPPSNKIYSKKFPPRMLCGLLSEMADGRGWWRPSRRSSSSGSCRSSAPASASLPRCRPGPLRDGDLGSINGVGGCQETPMNHTRRIPDTLEVLPVSLSWIFTKTSCLRPLILLGGFFWGRDHDAAIIDPAIL